MKVLCYLAIGICLANIVSYFPESGELMLFWGAVMMFPLAVLFVTRKNHKEIN